MNADETCMHTLSGTCIEHTGGRLGIQHVARRAVLTYWSACKSDLFHNCFQTSWKSSTSDFVDSGVVDLEFRRLLAEVG